MNHHQTNTSLSTLISELLDAGVDDLDAYLDAVLTVHHEDRDLLQATAFELVQREGWLTLEAGIWAMLNSAVDALGRAIADRDAHLSMCAALQAAGSALALRHLAAGHYSS